MTPILTPAQDLGAGDEQQQAFDTPHRPDTTSTRYTLWTEHHDQETADLNPCAQRLYRWLLERAAGGTEQEVDLEEFQYSTSSQKREKGYHIKHILRSFASLLTAGFVVVTRPYTNRVMRLVVRHAGSIRAIQLGQKSSQRNFQVPERTQSFQSEPETLMAPSSIQRNLQNSQIPKEGEGCDDELLEEIEAVIANAPFVQDSNEPESFPRIEPAVESKFSAPVARAVLERLRNLGIPPATEVRSLVARIPETQLERNISALEEEAATKGLKSPIAAFKYFVVNNCQPCNDRQAWWNRAAAALGKQQRDRLIQSVTEHLSEVVVMFTNGRRLALAEAQGMTWEAIAALGEMP